MGNQQPPITNPPQNVSTGIGQGGRPASPAEEFGALNYVQNNIQSGGAFPPAQFLTPDEAIKRGVIPQGIGKGG